MVWRHNPLIGIGMEIATNYVNQGSDENRLGGNKAALSKFLQTYL
jgi:hypothetical protein